jgi:hypothetical protein
MMGSRVLLGRPLCGELRHHTTVTKDILLVYRNLQLHFQLVQSDHKRIALRWGRVGVGLLNVRVVDDGRAVIRVQCGDDVLKFCEVVSSLPHPSTRRLQCMLRDHVLEAVIDTRDPLFRMRIAVCHADSIRSKIRTFGRLTVDS